MRNDQALSFGEDPVAYDRHRPRYPEPLYDALLDDGVGPVVDVLDIGCGTGIAGAPLVDRGCRVLGVEPDARMSALAARRGITVEQGTFEEWDDAGRRFDLAIAGQSWHWVDEAVGGPKVLSLLRPGRMFAAFWNVPSYPPEVAAVFDDVYGRLAPDQLVNSVALGRVPFPDDQYDAIFVTDRRQTLDEWLDELPTHSSHRTADADLLARITEELRTHLPDPVPHRMRTKVILRRAPGT